MSGYLEVKYPFKSNLGLNPFKSWKRQWCILRPSPTFLGGTLAVYCSEAGAAAGSIELPAGFVVRRAKSRTRPYAFAVFPTDEPRKPRVLLAANTIQDAQMWMEKINALINGNKLLDSEGSLKDSFSVTVTATELSRKSGLSGADSTVSVTTNGVLVSHSQRPVLVQWKHICDASFSTNNGDRNGTCILTVDSGFIHGSGSLHFASPLAESLSRAVRRSLDGRGALPSRNLSKSDGDLNKSKYSDHDIGEARRSSWYSGPSEASLDDLDLVMSKAHVLCGPTALASCRGRRLPPALGHEPACSDDSMCDRRSVSSGIYEEILEAADEAVYCRMSRDRPLGLLQLQSVEARVRPEEPTYESVAERPPPLPPRAHGVGSRRGSLARLPPAAPLAARTLPRWDRSRHAFSAFRKRLKSDSRTVISPKSETPKEKDVETKKKKFDFTPTRDIFKSFKVSRKMKNLKIAPGALTKGETKSCEFLDDTELVRTNRCSKSIDRLEGNDAFLEDFDADLSIELALPKEIVELILKGHETLTQMCSNAEGDYTPMSPVVPPPALQQRYGQMSPRTNAA